MICEREGAEIVVKYNVAYLKKGVIESDQNALFSKNIYSELEKNTFITHQVEHDKPLVLLMWSVCTSDI